MYVSKGRLRLSRRELWNLNDTLAKIICDALKQFKKENVHGFPCDMYKEIGYETDYSEIIPDDVTQAAVDEWSRIIDFMIYFFDHKNKPYTDVNVRLGNMQEVDNDQRWQDYCADMYAWEAGRAEAAEFFGRFMWHLWD